MTQPLIGDKSICESCGEPIRFLGQYWAHIGNQPRHIATPQKAQTMTATEYQRLAGRTLIDGPDFQISDNDLMIAWNAIGLAGEAGEINELVKKGVFHQHGLDREKMFKELGDCMWYIAALCSELDFDLGEVMTANIDKLRKRYPEGYNPEDSKRRVDVQRDYDHA